MEPELQPGCTSDLEKYIQLKLRMPDLPLGYSAALLLISIALLNSKGHFAFQHAWTTPWRAMPGALEFLKTNRAEGRWTRTRCHWCLEVRLHKQSGKLFRKRLSSNRFQRSDSSREKTGHSVLILLELTDCHYYLISILNVIHYNE